MARSREPEIEHLFRRAGFGASAEEIDDYVRLGLFSFSGAAARLVNYRAMPDDVDALVGAPGYAGVTAAGGLRASSDINHARQRWIFRMLHTRRPLEEKMTLFWHNYFATAYGKIAGEAGALDAVRMLAGKRSENPGGVQGQIEMLRERAMGNFRDMLVAIAQNPAMLFWLDGRSNVRARPQENFARELMELFTIGVGEFAEADVYAGARVFTGWNLARPGAGDARYYAFAFNAAQHDTAAKEFTFPIYPGGGRAIPARAASAGLQDGLDLIDALAAHPATGPRLARKLYAFFISEVNTPDEALIRDVASIYYTRGYEIEPMVRRLLLSPQFRDPASYYTRYAWPVEFVVRAIKEVGWTGFSVNDTLTPLANMGQQLFEPPDVNGWGLGPDWFSTGAMLARMNFAAQLATNQKFNLRDLFRPAAASPERLVAHALDRLTPPAYPDDAYRALVDYTHAGGAWTGSDAQLASKPAGLVHLIAGSAHYQFV